MNTTNRQRPGPPDGIAAQKDALVETIESAQALRDDLLRQDEHSGAYMILVQVTLILQRLQHGVPSSKESFNSLLGPVGLAERETVEVKV